MRIHALIKKEVLGGGLNSLMEGGLRSREVTGNRLGIRAVNIPPEDLVNIYKKWGHNAIGPPVGFQGMQCR